MKHADTLPLTMAVPGQPVKLVEVSGGVRLVRRLAELGLTPGVELEVMQNEAGPLLLCVRDTRLAIGRGMAHRMIVTDARNEVPRQVAKNQRDNGADENQS
jgi:Fe2+ transport system protein FeoA